MKDRLELTDRQREILVLKANGYTCREIGRMIKPPLSTHSVHGALFQIYRKYGASNDVNAVAVAIALGDIGIDEVEVPTGRGRRERTA